MKKNLEGDLEKLRKDIRIRIKDEWKQREAYSALRTLSNLLFGENC